MDYDKERFYNISTEKEFREFMKKADEVDTRDAMEPNEWKSACEYAGIKYSDYDKAHTSVILTKETAAKLKINQ